LNSASNHTYVTCSGSEGKGIQIHVCLFSLDIEKFSNPDFTNAFTSLNLVSGATNVGLLAHNFSNKSEYFLRLKNKLVSDIFSGLVKWSGHNQSAFKSLSFLKASHHVQYNHSYDHT
jgi:hypothetical protein